ncbi:hypothetical protein ATANTOWER_026916, partial [Ataeniobius toweri]|nr:hypothetical protein [Ataeniobius toweri]
ISSRTLKNLTACSERLIKGWRFPSIHWMEPTHPTPSLTINGKEFCANSGRGSERTLEADKEECIPGALNLFPPVQHKACEAGRVSPHSDRQMMLKHVGESFQRPRSQLLHQILYFRLQHPVLEAAVPAYEANRLFVIMRAER